MINVIHGGSPLAFDMLLFGEQPASTQNYIQSQLSGFNQTMTDLGRQFMETSREIYDRLNDSNTIRMAKAAIRMAKGIFHPNTIHDMATVEDLRLAQPLMQRYIMAEPTLREKFRKQQVDGYSNTYVDIEPGLYGSAQYDYRQVMSGVVQDFVDESGEDSWKSVNYFHELHPDDNELSITDKHTVLKVWDLVRMALDAEVDPTDIFAKD